MYNLTCSPVRTINKSFTLDLFLLDSSLLRLRSIRVPIARTVFAIHRFITFPSLLPRSGRL